MNLNTSLSAHAHMRVMINNAIEQDFTAHGLDLPNQDVLARVTIDPHSTMGHVDFAVNAAMVLAQFHKSKPRDWAGRLAVLLRADEYKDVIASVDVAGPGFTNIKMQPAFWHKQLAHILSESRDYGKSDIGKGQKVNIEYVSANPTGFLHLGHVRGAVFGDVLAGLLDYVGFDVCREYYINDAGVQIQTLARTVYYRYLELLGVDVGALPPDAYPGSYVIDIAQKLLDQDDDRHLSMQSIDNNTPEKLEMLDYMGRFAVDILMKEIKYDLGTLGIHHDVFTSERALCNTGKVGRAIDRLRDKGLIYQGVLEKPKGKEVDDWAPIPQTLFKSSDFGDDMDRVVARADGELTYFARDIAYHDDKYQRGHNIMIDVLGADHGGYVKRIKATVAALSDKKCDFDVRMCQIVHVLKDGKPIRMSKRSGDFITLRDFLKTVDPDVIRFMLVSRKNDQHLEFDIDLVQQTSMDNPIFYVQYAFARSCSVMRQAMDVFKESIDQHSLLKELLDMDITDPENASIIRNIHKYHDIISSHLTHDHELKLLHMLSDWPRLVDGAATSHEPHRIVNYLIDVAGLFHSYWNIGRLDTKMRFIHEHDVDATIAKLLVLRAVQTVIHNALSMMGIKPKTSM